MDEVLDTLPVVCIGQWLPLGEEGLAGVVLDERREVGTASNETGGAPEKVAPVEQIAARENIGVKVRPVQAKPQQPQDGRGGKGECVSVKGAYAIGDGEFTVFGEKSTRREGRFVVCRKAEFELDWKAKREGVGKAENARKEFGQGTVQLAFMPDAECLALECAVEDCAHV